MNALLPPQFEMLEPFVESWAIAGAVNRAQHRSASSESQRLDFYNAAKDVVAPALAYLDQKCDQKALNTFDENEQRLMNLILSFAHIAQAVEVQQGNEAAHARLRKALTLTRASADF